MSSIKPLFCGGELQPLAPKLIISRIQSDTIVRFVLAIVLLIATLLKVHELATVPTLDQDSLSTRWFLVGLVECELFASLWFFSGLQPRITHLAAMTGFSLFAVVALSKALSGSTSCGCFGRVAVNPWLTFVFDVLAVAALVWTRPAASYVEQTASKGISPNTHHPTTRFAFVIVAWLLLGVPGGLAMASFHPIRLLSERELIGNDRIVVLEPETWIGRQLPLVRHIDIGADLSEGEWVIVLYHHDCPKCQEVLPIYEREAKALHSGAERQRIALIEMPPFGNLPISKTTRCLHGRLSNSREWFVSAPAEILVRQGIVVGAGSSQVSTSDISLSMDQLQSGT